MSAQFVIPSIFTAIDKVTAPLRAMGKSASVFASKAETGLARADRAFRRFTPGLGEASKQMLSMVGTAALVGSAFAGISFTTSAIQDYEKSIASFRTIVSDLSDKDFSEFQSKVNAVAKDTKKSSIDVAASFEKIAGLNAEFAKTADGLAAVSKASITLSKASGDELGVAAENLVGIMNQYSMGAQQADRAINVLAAGQAVGATSITQTAESMKNFGSVAAGANITLEESVGLIQTMGKFSLFGAEAGTKLRGSVLKLQQAGVGYASGQFNINDALAEAKKKVDALATAEQKDAAILKMFGAENITAGKILLNNIDTFNKYTEGVTGTSEAQKAAEINSQTLSNRLDELKNAWVNIVTSSGSASSALDNAKTVIQFVTDNLGTILSVGIKVILFFVAWKAAIIAGRAALFAYNVVLGVSNVLQGKSAIALRGSQVALAAYGVASKAVTAAQWLWNAAMLANPIGLIIIGIAALIAIIVAVIAKYDEWGAAVSLFMGPLGAVINLIQSFRRNWDMIVQAFKTDGIVGGLKAIGKTLLDAVLMPLQQLLELASKLPDWLGGGLAKSGADKIEGFRASLGVNMGDTSDETKPAVNPEAEKQEAMIQRMESTNNAKLDINIKDPNNRVETKTSGKGLVPLTTSTMGFS